MVNSSLSPSLASHSTSPRPSTPTNQSSTNQYPPCILKFGSLNQKKSYGSTTRKNVALVLPKTIQDVHIIFEQFFVLDPTRPSDSKNIGYLGQITHAATRGNFKI